jgi:hypothetical protein
MMQDTSMLSCCTLSYKRESYRGSEFAGRILADNGINVVYKASTGYSSLNKALTSNL